MERSLGVLRERYPHSSHLEEKVFENYNYPLLIKNYESVDAERVNSFIRVNCANLIGPVVDDNEHREETIVDELILSIYTNARDSRSVNSSQCIVTPRVCFIHSCLLPNRSPDILIEILELVHNSSLIDELINVFVLNSGVDITSLASYASMRASFPKVTFIQRSSDTSRFEVSTMRHISSFVKAVTSQISPLSPELDVQILYLHTKGVSYQDNHVGVVDWRNMMLYFMVEQHRRCYHLLASGEFDAVGTNCHPEPSLHFAGNMWWATASYLQSLIPLEFERAGKFTAELWVLSGRHYNDTPRVKDLHLSNVDHYIEAYPRERYALC
eukprot:CAMPEP_0170072506 /NCGR_PEP_ID=MMETSP0019_2-20121128/10128_1 /TAXON_ID=98059 /ORGANISM="Dinobryon sp., Strain UTEXLB2267" /LENGTH=326 /DNA_ID=CAMNT_0010281513 /DNA_START=325 /DNA_END=1305 /DNA_ORIENTATION=-